MLEDRLDSHHIPFSGELTPQQRTLIYSEIIDAAAMSLLSSEERVFIIQANNTNWETCYQISHEKGFWTLTSLGVNGRYDLVTVMSNTEGYPLIRFEKNNGAYIEIQYSNKNFNVSTSTKNFLPEDELIAQLSNVLHALEAACKPKD